MEKNRISVAFVAVFAQPLSTIPVPSSDSCKELFGKNVELYQAMTPSGYLIASKSQPSSAIVINLTRIMFRAEKAEDLANYVEKFFKLPDISCSTVQYSAYGVNSEYEFLDLGMGAAEWMWKIFINSSIDINPTGNLCTKLSFKFVESADESMNFEIEPRNGVSDGLYVSVNHHHERAGMALPSKEELIQLFSHSEDLIDNKYFKKIISE